MRRPLLLPLVPLYAAGLALRKLRLNLGWEPVQRLRYPVISIGNLSTGGSGKTPLVIALVRLLSVRGFEVDVLSRGYGRNRREPARVQANGTAEEFGDEPLLIARSASVPVYVAPARYDAGTLAEEDFQSQGEVVANESGNDFSRAEKQNVGASAPESRSHVHILDDGFQHRQLHRDIDILLVSRADWHDQLLPAGNLREALHAAKRADVLAIPADDVNFESELRTWGWAGPIWRLQRRMETPHVTGPVLAFCGIARPAQFFAGLKAAGLNLVCEAPFNDHHRYSPRDVERLVEAARSANATALITTEKDEVRLGALATTFPPSLPLKAACLSLSIEDEAHVSEWLTRQLGANRILQSL